ncbi:MAG: hypothetical protein QOJ37_3529 [Pseudonocardiales bacterium]|nr:hypothetical protein [Pseudonocardiales bacterium]
MTLPGLPDVAATYARTIVGAVRQEYPNAPRHVMRDDEDRPTPREAHPAFYGCFDWHSAVEMHWALVRMLRTVPEALPADEVRAVLADHLRADALAAEAAYLTHNPGWERPYGWGWALALAAEVDAWAADGEADARQWSANLRPLADVVAAGFVRWLPNLTYPERVGAHANSAFALARALPHARDRASAGDPDLLDAIGDATQRWFGSDADYPAAWEPGGADFLSAALAEAELVAALIEPAAFPGWLTAFLPGLAAGAPANLFTPAVVSDPTDGQGAHLHGLNLHRAYGFGLLAGRLSPSDPRVPVLSSARDEHAALALPAVVGEGWMVEHWLACYAVLLLS